MKTGTKIILIIILLAFTILTLISLLINSSITGNIIKQQDEQKSLTNLNTYSYTKAICNETNFCQDYEIVCKNNKTTARVPITGAVIQHSEDWQDPRNEEQRNKLC